MNILSLLTKEKHVAGLEISDSVVRIAFFRHHQRNIFKKESPTQFQKPTLVLVEEPIAANIIEDGRVVDHALLGKTLKALWSKAKLGTQYAIVSIPDTTVYSRIFSFPKSVDGNRLSDAMRLAINFQLPSDIEKSYLDWERVENPSSITNEISLAMIPQEVAQGYIQALDSAGIKTLALESHTSSIARVLEYKPEEILLVTEKTPDATIIFALHNGSVRFSRTLPLSFIPQEKIPEEIEKVKLALEAEIKGSKHVVREYKLEERAVSNEYKDYPELAGAPNHAKWLIALGGAVRGQIPEGQDRLISLLPVGTEEAYAYQKATTFITLIRNLAIGLAVFFVVVFLAAYIFVLTLANRAESTVSTLSVVPVPPELLEKEAWIKHINALTETGDSLLSEVPTWSMIIDEVVSRTIDGITISNMSVQGVHEKISLAGVARDRATLNLFKKTFQESALFTQVDLPITNLEQRSDIPFSLTFTLTDPALIYYK